MRGIEQIPWLYDLGLAFAEWRGLGRWSAWLARGVLRPGGALRLLEHVRLGGALGRLQDLLQPAWTAISGGCHPNRDTEAAVARAGFVADPATRRARGTLRRLAARAPPAAAQPASVPPRR